MKNVILRAGDHELRLGEMSRMEAELVISSFEHAMILPLGILEGEFREMKRRYTSNKKPSLLRYLQAVNFAIDCKS